MAIGALIVFVSIGIGVSYGRCNQGQHNDDSDVRTYVPIRDRGRSRDKRVYDKVEKVFVLNNVKRLTHGWEREIMDAIIEDIERGKE